MIENKLKVQARRCSYARILVGHQGEEVIVPLEKLGEFLHRVTTDTELVLGDDLKGMHSEWNAGVIDRAAQGGLVDEGRVRTHVHGQGASAEMELAKYNVDVDAGVQKHAYKERQEHLLKALEKGLISPEQYLAAQAAPGT
jgi:hypothetical protein